MNRVEGGLKTRGCQKKSIPGNPLVSIITVALNGEKHLEQTIQSVVCQSYRNIEYIIIDGGSTDGTLDIIKKHEEKIDYWISEPDNGIYDAMNKGIKLAQGELVGILNANDYYHQGAVQTIVVEALKHPESHIIHGDLEFLHTNGIRQIWRSKDNISKYDLFRMPINHPTAFVRASCYRDCGYFDVHYRSAADYDLILKFFLECKLIFHYAHSTIAFMRGGGISENYDFRNFLQHEKILFTRRAPLAAIFMFNARYIVLMLINFAKNSRLLHPIYSFLAGIRRKYLQNDTESAENKRL